MNGFYKGFIFILLGNLVYYLSEFIKKIEFKKIGIISITILEVLLYIISIFTMHYNVLGTALVAIIFQIAIAITFSNKSLTSKYCNFSIFKKLGHFGFIMYLNNIYVRSYFIKNNLVTTYEKTTLQYIGVVVIISIIMYVLVPLLQKFISSLFNKFRIIFIQKNN